jgi:2-polyprenyl-3-methyl-5-hydroxy-6-metoxy-1,4-benzoquinol methylase
MPELFDSHCLGYDDWYLTPEGAFVDRAETAAILGALGGDVGGKRILDVGCGTGYFTAKLARAGADMTGIDISAGMLAVARARSAGSGLNITYIMEDIFTAALPDNSFDAAYANTVLEFIPDAAGVCASVMRLLKPGGVFVVGAINGRGGWTLKEDESGELTERCRYFTKDSLIALAPANYCGMTEALFAPRGLPEADYTPEADAEYRARGYEPGYFCAAFRKSG